MLKPKQRTYVQVRDPKASGSRTLTVYGKSVESVFADIEKLYSRPSRRTTPRPPGRGGSK